MDHLLHDCKIAFRSLLRHRSFSLIALLTLALGTGATTAVFSVVNGVILKPFPYSEAERIVSIWGTARDNPGPNVVGTVSHLNYLDWKASARSFESMALYGGGTYTLNGFGEAELAQGGRVTPDFFKVFRATPVMGRTFTADEDKPTGPRVAIVGYSFWKDRLNSRPDVIGTTINLNAGPTEIVGVAPVGFDFPKGARIWVPMRADDTQCGRGCVYNDVIARLNPGVSVTQAWQEMQSISAELEQRYHDNVNFSAGVMRLQDEAIRDIRTPLLFILASVAGVLLIACANVANLVLVRGTARQSEIAVRAALGGGRSRIFLHLLIENSIVALAGGMGGLLLAWWGIDALKQIAPAGIPRLNEVRFEGLTFGFSIALSAITMLLFGLWPSLRLSRTRLSGLLNSRGDVAPTGMSHNRALLVTLEVALSLMLLVGAGLLLRSLVALESVDPGFRTANLNIFTINLPALRYPDSASVLRTFERIDEQLEAIPGVSETARISGLPLSGSENVHSMRRPDRPPDAPGQGDSPLYRVVDSDYFKTMGIPLKTGRVFTPADSLAKPIPMIISVETARKYWGGEDPIGKNVRISSQDVLLTVVGVVANVRSQTLMREAQPELYIPHFDTRTMTFVLRSNLSEAQLFPIVRSIVRNVDSNLPLIRPGSMQRLVDLEMANTRFCLLLAALFSVIASGLAAVGTYGVVAYAVVQRRREVGLRLALGASPRALVARIMWEGFRPALAGIAIGIGGALAASRVIRSLLFNVGPNDPVTFIGVAGLMASLVLLATALPASRTTHISPADTLRGE